MTTATLSPLDDFLVDLLRAHGSPHVESTERIAARDARDAEAMRHFARTKAGRLFFNGTELTTLDGVPDSWQFAPEPIPRVRLAQAETRRPRRGLLRRAWEWVTG